MSPDGALRSAALASVRPVVAYPKVAHEWFAESAWAVQGPLDMVAFHGTIYDPSCGGGTIPKVVADAATTPQGRTSSIAASAR